jgi:hypothetical protein
MDCESGAMAGRGHGGGTNVEESDGTRGRFVE